MKKIGVLTSGGDAPGMNAAVMAIARSAAMYGMTLVGIKRGYNGLLSKPSELKNTMIEMPLDMVLDIADQPGTYLRTARCDEFREARYQDMAAQALRDMGIEGLVVIGGDGSFQGAKALCERGIHCIGIPGTIDNDLAYTDMTLGFETAVQVCTDAVRSIRATSRSHDRPAVVEVMGRHCGDIAVKVACATGAEMVLVPEVPWKVEEAAARLNKLIAMGNPRATIIVAEGCWDSMAKFDLYEYLTTHGKYCAPGTQMDSPHLASVLKRMCNAEVRATVIGYTQRGCAPVAKDSAFAFEAGNLAVRLLRDGISNQVIGVQHGRVYYTEISQALKAEHTFRHDLYHLVNTL